MGEAKRRKSLDPNYGKKKSFLEALVKEKIFRDEFWHGVFLCFKEKPIVICNLEEGEEDVALGMDEHDKRFIPVRNYLAKHKPHLVHLDLSKTKLLIFNDETSINIVPIPEDEINNSLNWAEQNNIPFVYPKVL